MNQTEQTRETVTVLGVECRGEETDARGFRGDCEVSVKLYAETVSAGFAYPERWQVFVRAPHPVSITIAGHGATRDEAEAEARRWIVEECPRIAERLGLGRAA